MAAEHRPFLSGLDGAPRRPEAQASRAARSAPNGPHPLRACAARVAARRRAAARESGRWEMPRRVRSGSDGAAASIQAAAISKLGRVRPERGGGGNRPTALFGQEAHSPSFFFGAGIDRYGKKYGCAREDSLILYTPPGCGANRSTTYTHCKEAGGGGLASTKAAHSPKMTSVLIATNLIFGVMLSRSSSDRKSSGLFSIPS